MGDRGAGESRPPSRSPWLLPSNGRRGCARRRRVGCRRVGATRGLARRAALSDAVGRVAGGGAMDQRASEDSSHPAALVRGCASPPGDRAADVAGFFGGSRAPKTPPCPPQPFGKAPPRGGAPHPPPPQ